MNKFKKGDRVIILDDPSLLGQARKYIGQTGTVDEDNSRFPYVRFDDGEFWSYNQDYLKHETMNKATELKALKEQLQQFTDTTLKKIQEIEKTLQTDIWKDGYWLPNMSGLPHHRNIRPSEIEIILAAAYTTEANCQAWIDYQKACVVLRDACKPYLTEGFANAYIPVLNHDKEADSSEYAHYFPKYLWVNGEDKALEIAAQCKAELLIIQNFKWEI